MLGSDRLNYFKLWVSRHVGELGETSLKHRSNILLLSTLMLFLDSDVKIVLGKASLAGLGITIEPTQTIPVGLFLFSLLLYRLFAFWASVLLESGTDKNIAGVKARDKIDPEYFAEESRSGDMDQAIRNISTEIIYKWQVRKIFWEFIIPNVLAFISLGLYVDSFYQL